MNKKSIPEQTVGTVVLVVREGKVLLGIRKNSYKSGYYGLPGGRVESTEKLVDCAKRELAEETGIIVDNLDYIGVIKDQQEGYSFIHFAFLCKDFNGEPTLTEPEKCEGWKWFESTKIPTNTLIAHKVAIDMYIKFGPPSLREVSSV